MVSIRMFLPLYHCHSKIVDTEHERLEKSFESCEGSYEASLNYIVRRILRAEGLVRQFKGMEVNIEIIM